MAALTRITNTAFTPTQNIFRVQANGEARLMTRNASDVDWVVVCDDDGEPVTIKGVEEINNNVIGAQYKLEPIVAGTTVAADE